MASLEQRERRLVQLFMVDDISEDSVREEAANLSRQKKAVEEKLAGLRVVAIPAFDAGDMEHLRRICTAVEAWLADASEEQWSLVFESLQVSVEATRGRLRCAESCLTRHQSYSPLDEHRDVPSTLINLMGCRSAASEAIDSRSTIAEFQAVKMQRALGRRGLLKA